MHGCRAYTHVSTVSTHARLLTEYRIHLHEQRDPHSLMGCGSFPHWSSGRSSTGTTATL